MSILDGGAVRRRRLELGMSERELAKRVAVTQGVISALEGGTNHSFLPLGFVASLADQLGVGIGALLASGTDHESASQGGSPLGARLAGMLVMAGGSAQTESLAEAAGCSLSDLAAEIRSLNAAFAGLGLEVVRTSAGTVRLRSTDPRASELADGLARAEVVQRGLGHGHARVLFEIAQGRADAKWQREGGEARRIAVGFLERSGLVTRGAERLELSEDARYSLVGFENPSGGGPA